MDSDCIDGYQVHGEDQGVIYGILVDGYQDHGNITNNGGVNDNSDVSSKLKSSVLGYYSSPNNIAATHTNSIYRSYPECRNAALVLDPNTKFQSWKHD